VPSRCCKRAGRNKDQASEVRKGGDHKSERISLSVYSNIGNQLQSKLYDFKIDPQILLKLALLQLAEILDAAPCLAHIT
jgi:hypothetical protein